MREVALVTGAVGAIGAATATAFRDAGYTVVTADRAPGADIEGDLAEAEVARAAVERAVELHGRLNAVVIAHGISGRSLGDGPVADCTEEAWDAVLAANLRSVFLVSKFAVPRLVDAGGGAIVAVGSVLGLVGGDEDFATHAYAASKAGLVGLVRAIAVTYARQGVRANVVAPGPDRDADERPRAGERADSRAPARAAASDRRLRPARGRRRRRRSTWLGRRSPPVRSLPLDGGWTAR